MSIKKELATKSIFSIYPDGDAIKIIEFYLYYAAPICDSPLSLDLSNSLSSKVKHELVLDLCDMGGCSETDFVFPTFGDNKEKELHAACLSDETFSANRMKGFFWRYIPRKQPESPEDSFDCIIKHIRNAIAHGRITDINQFALLEDKHKDITMRFIVKPSVLLAWSDVIQATFDA